MVGIIKIMHNSIITLSTPTDGRMGTITEVDDDDHDDDDNDDNCDIIYIRRGSNLKKTLSCDWDSVDMDLEERQMKKHLNHLKNENDLNR